MMKGSVGKNSFSRKKIGGARIKAKGATRPGGEGLAGEKVVLGAATKQEQNWPAFVGRWMGKYAVSIQSPMPVVPFGTWTFTELISDSH